MTDSAPDSGENGKGENKPKANETTHADPLTKKQKQRFNKKQNVNRDGETVHSSSANAANNKYGNLKTAKDKGGVKIIGENTVFKKGKMIENPKNKSADVSKSNDDKQFLLKKGKMIENSKNKSTDVSKSNDDEKFLLKKGKMIESTGKRAMGGKNSQADPNIILKDKVLENANKANFEQKASTGESRGDTLSAAELKKERLKEKRKLKKKQKKLQNASTGTTLENTKKKKQNAVPNLPVFKLTIRKLPPNLTQAAFVEKVISQFSDFLQHVNALYYVDGHSPEVQYEASTASRCYINCKSEQSMMIVGRTIKGITFIDEVPSESGDGDQKGNSNAELYEDLETYIPVIEKSFYQELPPLTKPLVASSDESKGMNPLMEISSELQIDDEGLVTTKLEDVAVYQLFCELLEEEGRTHLPADIFKYKTLHEAKQKAQLKKMKKKKPVEKAGNKKGTNTSPSTDGKTDTPKKKKKKSKKKAKKKKKGAEASEN
jgi:hypothetical protein